MLYLDFLIVTVAHVILTKVVRTQTHAVNAVRRFNIAKYSIFFMLQRQV